MTVDDIDERDENGCTALMLAARSNSAEVLRAILEQKANVDVQDPTGWTALHYAILGYGSESTTMRKVAVLLECGATVDPRNQKMETPLLLAAQYGYSEIARYLLDHNANLHVVDGAGGPADKSSISRQH